MSWKDDINYGLAAFGVQIPNRIPIDDWAAGLSKKPLSNTLYIVGLSAGLFYVAEKDHNPKVNSIEDALVYCSTCISVGYHDVFPHTPIGKLIATALMAIGPALAAHTMDGTSERATSNDNVQHQMLETLQQIAEQLKAKGSAS